MGAHLWDNFDAYGWTVFLISSLKVSKICLLSSALVLFAAGCAPMSNKPDISKLIKSSIEARAAGHEDLAANDLKEAYENLPASGTPGRVEAINQLYLPTLDLAADLRKSGRLSLSNTMYDKAIEIEAECTIGGRASARRLKRETEEVFDTEERIITTAGTSSAEKVRTKALQDETESLERRVLTGDPKPLEEEALKHLGVIRNSFGIASFQYVDAFRVTAEILVKLHKAQTAIRILEVDSRQLSEPNLEIMKTSDIDAVQDLYFHIPLKTELAYLQIKTGQLDEAEQNARKSCELAKHLGGTMKGRLAVAQLTLATVLSVKGDKEGARRLLKETLPLLREEKLGKDSERCKKMIEQIEKAQTGKQ
jgi:hypothetical protein